jgi:hypothetical protein
MMDLVAHGRAGRDLRFARGCARSVSAAHCGDGERAKTLGNAQEAGTPGELGIGGRAARALQDSFMTAAPAMGMRVNEEATE